MKDLQDATSRICDLKGSVLATEVLLAALVEALPPESRERVARQVARGAEVARTVLLNSEISEQTLATFEVDVQRTVALVGLGRVAPRGDRVEPLLLTTTHLTTHAGERTLTGASGFFFERDERLFLVTSRHVVSDPVTLHAPDRLTFEMHVDVHDPTRVEVTSVPLYRDGLGRWRQARDAGGDVDVVALEIDRAALSPDAVYRAFTPRHLVESLDDVEVGAPLRVPGFPLGFHDVVNRLPIVRQACVASSFGVRFQGQGCFLTDARTHRGSSGAPVVLRDDALGSDLPWRLLGVHSSRIDMRDRDLAADESLGLNCAWYADILLTLTDEPSPDVPAADAPSDDGPTEEPPAASAADAPGA